MTPKQARVYIENFRKYVVQGIDFVETPSRRIYLNDMTDDDAIFIAEEFAKMEAEAARQSKVPKQ